MTRRPLSVNQDQNKIPTAQFELGCGEVIVGIVTQRLSARLDPSLGGSTSGSKVSIAALVRRPVERCAAQPTVVTLSVPFFKSDSISSRSLSILDDEVAHLQEVVASRHFGSGEDIPALRSDVCAGKSLVAFLWGAHPNHLDVALVSTAKSLSKLKQNCSKAAPFSDRLDYLSKAFAKKTRRWQKVIDPWSLVELRVKPTKAVFKSKDGRLSVAVTVDCHERILGAVFSGRDLRGVGVLVSRFVNQRPVLCDDEKLPSSKTIWHHLPKDVKVDLAQKFLPIDAKDSGAWGERVFVEEPTKIQMIGRQNRIRLSSMSPSLSIKSNAPFGVVVMQDHLGRVAAGILKHQKEVLSNQISPMRQTELTIDVPASVVGASLKQAAAGSLSGLKINAAYF